MRKTFRNRIKRGYTTSKADELLMADVEGTARTGGRGGGREERSSYLLDARTSE
jgi:hypothetical protein